MPHQLMARTSQPLIMMMMCQPMIIRKIILVSTLESPSDVIKGDSGIDVVGNTSPLSHQVFPSFEPSSPGENTNCFTFGPSKSFPNNVEDLCLLDLAILICEIGGPLSAFN